MDGILGSTHCERATALSLMALPTCLVAGHVFMATRPLFNTSLMTGSIAGLTSIGLIDASGRDEDGEYRDIGRLMNLCLGAAFAVGVWSAYKAATDGGAIGYGANALVNGAIVALVGYSAFFGE